MIEFGVYLEDFKFKKEDKVKVFEAFSGVGMQRMALDKLGANYESVGYSEIDANAIRAYSIIHDEELGEGNYGSITDIKGKDLPDIDLFTYSFPCFPAGTMVTTKRGLKCITEVKVGELVLTHKNRWRKVTNTFANGIKEIVDLKVSGLDPEFYSIQPTLNHKFWVRDCIDEEITQPYWCAVGDFSYFTFVGVNVDGLGVELPEGEEGVWFGDVYFDGIYMWYRVSGLEFTGKKVDVYDIEVEEDHSFLANGIVVHNCTDLSLLGDRKGLSNGTRSGLVYEVLRVLDELKKEDRLPKVLLMENVAALLGKTYGSEFYKIQEFLESLGYRNYTQMLSAHEYGTHQSRARVFMVSLLGDYKYEFPKKEKLKGSWHDLLEPLDDILPIAHFVTESSFESLMSDKVRGQGVGFIRKDVWLKSLNNTNNYAKCLDTWCVASSTANVVKVPVKDLEGKLDMSGKAIYEGNYLRWITPREAWRLMGISDEVIDKIIEKQPKTVMFKQAGNGIAVPVLERIFGNLFEIE